MTTNHTGRESFVADNRVCIVTGAGNGLGRGVARALAAEGWTIVANDVDEPALETLAAELRADGHRCLAVVGSVVDKADVDRTVAAAAAEFGQIYGLVNNAGLVHPASVLDLSVEDWDRVVDVNLKGAFLFSQAVARHMVEHRIPGRIVNMGSITGKIPRWHEVAYCASKAGVSHLTRVFALELAQYGITVNTLSPGSADAGVLWNHLGGDRSREAQIVKGDLETFRLGIPLGRLASVADVAAGVSFLLSPGAAHITGNELYVDGGQTMF